MELVETLREVERHNVVKRSESEGDRLPIGPMELVWKARGPETACQFSVYEMELAAGVGIPLHKHPYAEYFKVLQGDIAFAKLDNDGRVEWIECAAGDSVLAPPNAPHTFLNKSNKLARFMSVSTYYHEAMFFDSVAKADFTAGDTTNSQAAFGRFVQAAEDAQVYVVEA